jgi:ABC-2 type transport system permease protein
MFKLWSTIVKDFRILTRDRVGLAIMFAMPILLVIIITSVQNSTFELVNENRIAMLVCNKDHGESSKQLVDILKKMGMFGVTELPADNSEQEIRTMMQAKDALVVLVIPSGFSSRLRAKAEEISARSLKGLGLGEDSIIRSAIGADPLTLYYLPVMQQSFRQSIEGSLHSVLQIVQSKEIVRTLYYALHQQEIPDTLQDEIVSNQIGITEIPVSRNGSRNVPNASQHNVPAWTIFAMFFVVVSLGSSVVREKLNGSFVRLKTLPTSYLMALLSKQITYMTVTLLQAAVIFSIGIWIFPKMGLPALNLPADLPALFLVTLVCGWCAASFAICIGVFSETQEQANGIGSISVVMLAAIGGLLVPSFAMPASFRGIMKISPLHWCLESYYGLFLEGGKLKDIFANILSLTGITIFIQLVTLWGLKRKNLI